MISKQTLQYIHGFKFGAITGDTAHGLALYIKSNGYIVSAIFTLFWLKALQC